MNPEINMGLKPFKRTNFVDMDNDTHSNEIVDSA